MQDADLFMELAAIAGVFVGFGALIAVRSGGASDTFEVAYMRGVVSAGLLTIVAALAPVALGRYTLTDHEVWVASSAVVLVGLAAVIAINMLTPEYWEDATGRVRTTFPRWLIATVMVVVGLLLLAIILPPIVIILGLAPELEAALYFTAVVLTLLWAAWLLLQMVFRRHRPAAA